MKITKNSLFLGLIIVVIVSAIILNISQKLAPESEITNENPSEVKPTEQPSDQELFACQQNSDCIAVDTNACCTCANGGAEKAINKKYAAYWNDTILRRGEANCTETFCAALYNCSAAAPVCENSVCTIPSLSRQIK